VSEGHRHRHFNININTAPPLRRTQEQEASIVADDMHDDHDEDEHANETAAVDMHDDHDEHEHEDEHASETAAVDMHDDHAEHEHGSEFEESASQASDGDTNNNEKPWGYVIGASLIVNLTSLLGVVILFPLFYRLAKGC
jgi:hypothetical protein